MSFLSGFPRLGRRLWVYLKESRQELKKVNWPSRREVLRMTVMVLVFSGIVALILGGFDYLFDRMVLTVFNMQSDQIAPAPFGSDAANTQTIPVPIEEAPPPAETPPQ